MKIRDNAVDIRPLTLAELRADVSGGAIEQLAELIIATFGEPPWNENFSASRIHFGLGVELIRHNALLYVASENASGIIVGYVLGQELVKNSTDIRKTSLSGLSGTTAMDYLFDGGRRIFYVSGLAVRSDFRRRGIAENLSRTLLEDLGKKGYHYRLGRTDRTAIEMRQLYAKLGFSELQVCDAGYTNRTYWLLPL